jgi:hypothetical protein
VPKAARRRKRSPNLDLDRVERIVEIIRGWRGRLTWQALCNEIKRQTGDLYTRQALSKHVPIQAAYDAYQRKPMPAESDKSLSRAEKRIRTLQLKISELEQVRSVLLERFARWAVNAAEAGLTEEFLNRPLQSINRSENW